MNETFDIVYVCHEKDKATLVESLKLARKNIVGYRKIFLVANENLLQDHDDVVFVDESVFPFQLGQLVPHVPEGRAGWYFQQFLKLYFFRAMKQKILDNILVLDADTMFIRKTSFFDEGRPLYNVIIGHHEPYYELNEKLFGFQRQNQIYSGITHHMIFQRRYVEEILNFGKAENEKEFWREVVGNVDRSTGSGFSEYELYFNYMTRNHPEAIQIRKISFVDFPYFSKSWMSLFKMLGYYYVSAHDYLRVKRFSLLKSFALETLNFLRIRMPVKNALMAIGVWKQG